MGIEDEEEDREFTVNRVLDNGFPDAVTLEMVAEAMDRDGEMKRIKEEVMRGKKSKETKNSRYDQVFEELSVMKGVLVKGDKIVVPKELQATVIKLSHETYGLG